MTIRIVMVCAMVAALSGCDFAYLPQCDLNCAQGGDDAFSIGRGYE